MKITTPDMTMENLGSDCISVSLSPYNPSAENNDNTIELNENALELKIRVKVIGTDDTKNDNDKSDSDSEEDDTTRDSNEDESDTDEGESDEESDETSDEIIRGSKGIYGAAGLIYLIYDSDSDIPTEKLFSRVTFKQTTISVGSTYEMVYTIYF